MSKHRVVSVGLLLVGLTATPAMAAISLTYAGAFKCATGGTAPVTGITEGGIAYYPSGNGGAGSLFITEGASSSRKELNEVTIPALVITSNPASLNTATTLNRWDEAATMPGVAYASDGMLYHVRSSGNQGFTIGSVNTDGTGFVATVAKEDWTAVMQGSTFDLIDSSMVSGYDKIVVAQDQSHKDLMMYAVNTSTAAKKQILEYDATHHRTGYASTDLFYGAALVENGADSALVVAGVLGGNNTLLFYNPSDIVNAGHTYDPQPYATLSIQDKIFAPNNVNYPHTIWGLTYDSAHKMLYAIESQYSEPDYVQAWLVPEPATLALLLCSGLMVYRRRRA
jgi:hypothetical protein